ncbi:MAG TPA: TetR/AcrR family transcriptional regulator [Clostridiales bacterium]|nr:TetR/AcrR family transcriptional regulator [Clostridiales bacterium]HQP70478.1 TetR/AcrR family transcriptional regulator [Clostridiales bacterium]
MSDTTNNKTNEIKDDIMNVAKELFIRYGLKKTTMDEIATGTRKSKTTIYQYFNNKEEILELILISEGRSLMNSIMKEINKDTNSVSELKTYIRMALNESKKKILLYSLVRGELKEALFNNYRLKNEIDTIEIELVRNILINGINSGQFSSKFKNHIDQLAYFITNFTRGLVIQLVMDDVTGKNSHNYEDSDIFVDIFTKGLKD